MYVSGAGYKNINRVKTRNTRVFYLQPARGTQSSQNTINRHNWMVLWPYVFTSVNISQYNLLSTLFLWYYRQQLQAVWDLTVIWFEGYCNFSILSNFKQCHNLIIFQRFCCASNTDRTAYTVLSRLWHSKCKLDFKIISLAEATMSSVSVGVPRVSCSML